jgi:hypothetical protein
MKNSSASSTVEQGGVRLSHTLSRNDALLDTETMTCVRFVAGTHKSQAP